MSVVVVEVLGQMATDEARQLIIYRMNGDVVCSFGSAWAFVFAFFCNVKMIKQRASVGEDCAAKRANIELETQGLLSVRSVCPVQVADQRFVIVELLGTFCSL